MTQRLAQQITKLIDNFETVPENLKAEFSAHLASGFSDWTQTDYGKFFRAFMRYEIGNIDAIVQDMDSKTQE